MSAAELWKAPVSKTLVYSQQRIARLIRNAEPAIQEKFLQAIRLIRRSRTLKQIAALLEAGRIDEALAGIEEALLLVTNETGVHFVRAGEDGAQFLTRGLNVIVAFDQTNFRAVERLQAGKFKLIREFTTDQRAAVREALVEGTRRGLNPIDQAREFRQSIGLTRRQVAAVNKYRQLLEDGSSQALRRQLRDRRFDPTIRRAIREGRILSLEQIDKMVDRYRDRFVAYRSKVIGRTEALRAVHEGNEELFQQAYDSGTLNKEQVTRTWHPARDAKVRDPAHTRMRGQTRPEGVPFTDGLGNSLMYPGDPSAPPATTIQCRCRVSRRIKKV